METCEKIYLSTFKSGSQRQEINYKICSNLLKTHNFMIYDEGRLVRNKGLI